MLTLTPEQREDLQRWAQSRTLPAGDVFRARLILALADGRTYREIARSLKTSLPTIARWKMRFERDGLAGLEGRHQGSKPRAATPKVQARVIRRVQQKPEDGKHALVLPETGERVGPEQVHGAADSSASATETAPTGTIYGQ